MWGNFPKGNFRSAASVPDIQAGTFRLKKDNFPKTIEHLGIIVFLKYALNPQYAKVENECLVNDLFKISSCNVCCFHCSARDVRWKIFWQSSCPPQMLIQQSWNQPISNFWANAAWLLASCQLPCARNCSPERGAPWLPRFPTAFLVCSGRQGFQCFPLRQAGVAEGCCRTGLHSPRAPRHTIWLVSWGGRSSLHRGKPWISGHKELPRERF